MFPDARERLAAAIEQRNAERGRPLTSREKLANLKRWLASGMETEGQDPAEGLGAEHDSPTAKPGRPDTSTSVASPSQEQM